MGLSNKTRNVMLISLLSLLGIIVLYAASMNMDVITSKEILREEKEQHSESIPVKRVPGPLATTDCIPGEGKFALDKSLPRPDFILIGVAKGGTTSFSNYLRMLITMISYSIYFYLLIHFSYSP